MTDDRFVLRRIVWSDVCPWLMIFRCFRLSIGMPLLFLATVGMLLALAGEYVLRRSLNPAAESMNWIMSPDHPVPAADAASTTTARSRFSWTDRGAVVGVARAFVQPVSSMFDGELSISRFGYSLFLTVWNIGVWGLFGGAITRIAVVKLGRGERVSIGDALVHTARNLGWYVVAPLFPLLGVALLSLPLIVLGLLLRFNFVVLLAGVAWPVVLLMGLLMAVLLLGLLGGWSMMWPTISAEEDSDAFEAFNRSFSYTFQRPLQLLFYAIVAIVFGELCWILVDRFAAALIALNHWAISIGLGSARGAELWSGAESSSLTYWAGSGLIRGWEECVRVIAQAFNYSFFFCVASAIYLLLRREVDQTDFDEVYLPEESARFGLSPLRPGPGGVPEVSPTTSEEPPPPSSSGNPSQ